MKPQVLPGIVLTRCEVILPPEALVAPHRTWSLLLQVLTALGFSVALLLPSATHLSPCTSAGQPRASRCPSRICHILRPTCWHLLLSLGKMLAWFPGQLNYVAPVICRHSRRGVLGVFGVVGVHLRWGHWMRRPGEEVNRVGITEVLEGFTSPCVEHNVGV